MFRSVLFEILFEEDRIIMVLKGHNLTIDNLGMVNFSTFTFSNEHFMILGRR